MKKLVLTIGLIFSLQFLIAQDFDGYYSASFDFNQPLSNTDWINSVSPLGVKLGYHRLLNEKFSIGGEFNWGTYKEYHPTETFYNDNGALTTDYFNYVYAYGLVVSGRYYLSNDKTINPYYGLGLGAAHNKFTTYYNVYGDQAKTYGFLARPEVGLLIRFSKSRAISGLIGAHYDYSTAAKSSYGYSNFSNVGVNVGIVILDW